MLQLNIGLRACPLGKHSQTMHKNFFPRQVKTRQDNFPRLVFTLMLKGGLYHVIIFFLVLRVFLCFLGVEPHL